MKETEELFAPAVTAMYIRAKGVEQSEAAVAEVRGKLNHATF